MDHPDHNHIAPILSVRISSDPLLLLLLLLLSFLPFLLLLLSMILYSSLLPVPRSLLLLLLLLLACDVSLIGLGLRDEGVAKGGMLRLEEPLAFF